LKSQIPNTPSAFFTPSDFSSEWRNITLLHTRRNSVVYTGERYGRRFLLKALAPDDAALTDYRLQQEQEFQLGVQLVHPNIAATYSLEDVPSVGRCIVQEWIDGITLGEWLQTYPARAARERAFIQLMDALEYAHGLQLVHHDLKADNILVTRNGANVKLIDFGLSATDATLTPVPNDVRADIQALARLLPALLPEQRLLARRCREGRYANIAALRRAYNRRLRLFRLLPVLLSVLLLTAAAVLFYLAWHERHAEQQRYDAMLAQVDTYIAQEREQILALAARPDSFDTRSAADMLAYNAFMDEYTAIRQRSWQLRDSLVATYPDSDPLREQLFNLWTHREVDLDSELFPQLFGKLRNSR